MPQIKNSIETRLPLNPEYAGKVYVGGRYYTADEVLAFTAHLVGLEAGARLAKEREEAKAKRDYLPTGTVIAVDRQSTFGQDFTAIKTAEWGWVRADGDVKVGSGDRLHGQDDSYWAKNGKIIYQPAE